MSTRSRNDDVSGLQAGCAPEELSTLFPTVLLRRRLPDAKSKNRRLRKIILEREKLDAGVRQSNVGGWHSTPDLWDWPNPEMRDLCDWVKPRRRI